MVGGSLRVLRLLPALKLVAMILLKVALNTNNQNQSHEFVNTFRSLSNVPQILRWKPTFDPPLDKFENIQIYSYAVIYVYCGDQFFLYGHQKDGGIMVYSRLYNFMMDESKFYFF